MPHSLWGEQVKTKQEGVSRWVFVSLRVWGACVACVQYFFFGVCVYVRGYGSHGKESTKSDVVHHKCEALAWLVYRRFPGINLNIAQPATYSVIREMKNGTVSDGGRRTAAFAIVCACTLPWYRTQIRLSASIHCTHRRHHPYCTFLDSRHHRGAATEPLT